MSHLEITHSKLLRRDASTQGRFFLTTDHTDGTDKTEAVLAFLISVIREISGFISLHSPRRDVPGVKKLRRKAYCVSALLLFTFVFAGCAATSSKPNIRFPDLRSCELEGKLDGDLAGKVLLVDFWASWCGPCKESFPAMEKLNQQYAGQGLTIIAVSVDDNRDDMQQFLAKQKVSFTTVRDSKQSLVAAANVSTMPTSFLIGRDGKIRYTHSGFRGDETVKQYQSEIEELLKEQPAGDHAK